MSARRLGVVMPWWSMTTTLLMGLTTALAWRACAPALFWGICVGALILVIVLTVTVRVALNTRIAGRAADDADDGISADVRRWDRLHALRICILACVVVVGALALSR